LALLVNALRVRCALDEDVKYAHQQAKMPKMRASRQKRKHGTFANFPLPKN
jgi:hypothetical protein